MKMSFRALRLAIALPLLATSSRLNAAHFVPAQRVSSPRSIAENASTAFLESGSESRIGLLCHNDPVNKSDPMGLYVSGLTSFGGGDWIRGTLAITNREMDLIKDRSFSSFFGAANARRDQAYNLSSKTREAGTEIWQRNDNSADYRSDQPRLGNELKEVHDKWENGKFLSFTVDPSRHPPGYHAAGWMYGHGFYRPEVPSADQHRAFERGWSAYLVTPAQNGALFKTPNVRLYNYPDTPSN